MYLNKGLDSVGMKKHIPSHRYSGFGNYNKSSKKKKNQYKVYSSESEKSDDSIFGDKGKTNKQIVSEFKAFTLPKMRLKNLVKLQARFRGHHVRNFVIPRLKALNAIAEDYVVRKVNEWLEVYTKLILSNNPFQRIK